MADKIFGEGLRPVPLRAVAVTGPVPAELADVARPVYIYDLPEGASQGAAVANAADEADAVIKLNALLASLRTAGVIAT